MQTLPRQASKVARKMRPAFGWRIAHVHRGVIYSNKVLNVRMFLFLSGVWERLAAGANLSR